MGEASAYRATLNLPKTNFPMKANLPAREPERLKQWEASAVYARLRAARQGAPRFVLHDGPPYANGEIHMGHALNKILKDIIVRYKTMQGFDAPYLPGWDCHGLPIEHQLLKEMGKRKDEVPRAELRKAARAYAARYVEIQRQGFKRLGIFGEWERPYLTMDYAYQAAIAECFLILFEKKFIERRLKPVPWCGECQTALADAELEYEQKTSESVYVKFRINPEKTSHVLKQQAAKRPTSIIVWTTTPWTLPANVGMAFHEDLTYVLVDDGKEQYIVAKDLLDELKLKLGWQDSVKIVEQFLGESFLGLEVEHPFLPRTSKGILAGFVSGLEGTGVVHIAPGHG
ncbi:MAG: class I tRNA ligase family protein, partial [Candidatus Omnitrophica bacterium]|nr:class I tRNA ligase family protein [Candidatus Omnitrophota bacterium]